MSSPEVPQNPRDGVFTRERVQKAIQTAAQASLTAVKRVDQFTQPTRREINTYLDKPITVSRRTALVGVASALTSGALLAYGLTSSTDEQKGGSGLNPDNTTPVAKPTVGSRGTPVVVGPSGAERGRPTPTTTGEVYPAPTLRPLVESEAARKRRIELAKQLEQNFPLMESQKNLEATTLPFLDTDANEAAKELGITHVGQLFDVPASIIPKLNAWLSNEKLKIFSPGVNKHEALLADMTVKEGIPLVLLQIHAQLESGGNELAGDHYGGDGQGLMQVEDQNFPPNTPREKKLEPDYNVHQAIEQVIKVNKRIAEDPNLPWKKSANQYKNSEAYKWLRIAQAFNEGNRVLYYDSAYTDRVSDTDRGITPIAQQYFDHVLRFAVIAEIAHTLKAKGFDDAQVAAKLTSYEVEARGNALEKAMLDQPDIKTYKHIKEVLGEASIDPKKAARIAVTGGRTLDEAYRDYLKSTNDGERNIQVNPAIRIWLNHDPSRGLWKNINNDLSEWQAMFAHAGIKVWRPATPTTVVRPTEPAPAEPETTEQAPVVPTPEARTRPEGRVVIEDRYIYNERDESWWDVEGDEESTCGPVSAAMAASALLGKRITPDVMDAHFQKRGIRKPVDDTYFRFLRRNAAGELEAVYGREGNVPQLLREVYGLHVEQLFDIFSTREDKRHLEIQKLVKDQDGDTMKAEFQVWKDALDKGALIIASAAHTMFVKQTLPDGRERFPNGADHIFVIEDIDLSDSNNITMTVVDPWDGIRRKGIPMHFMRTPAYAYAVATTDQIRATKQDENHITQQVIFTA